ncbi:reverse transcriptase domain-containing protein [Tanacetum coccineum]
MKLLDTSIIYLIVDSPWVSPIHCESKKGDITVVTNENDELVPIRTLTGWRICIDYRKLNEATAKDHFPLSFMDQMLERLAGNKYFYFLDGFLDISKFLSVIWIKKKQCSHVPSVHTLIGECLLDYVMLQLHSKDAHLVLNWEKCHFMVKGGIVLGPKVSGAGLEVNKAKINVISKLPPHTNIKDTPFEFDDECQKAFELLKEKLTCAPVIVSTNWNLPFELMYDASDFVVGAVLDTAYPLPSDTTYSLPLNTAYRSSDTESESMFSYLISQRIFGGVTKEVSTLNDNKIDFRISFDEYDDEDYTVIYDKNSFSYKIISVNDLKTDSKNDNDKVSMPLFPSPETTVSCLNDLDFFKYFENEFPTIVYHALTSKSYFSTEPFVIPQHIYEFDLEDETSLSKCDEEEQNVLYFNDIFPFNVIYPDELKSDKDNDDHEIDIEQPLGDMFVIPLLNVINVDDGSYAHGSNKLLETSHDTSNKFFKTKIFIKELNVNIMT